MRRATPGGRGRAALLAGALAAAPHAVAAAGTWNDPYPDAQARDNVLYSSFLERPKHLDPARSYSADEYTFIAQIYEPPLQYHYLRRPYELVPLTLAQMPELARLDADGEPLGADAEPASVAFTEYRFRIRPGIRYQPHPAFAEGADGRHLYHDLGRERVEAIHRLADLPEHGTRELVAADYVYQIKRLADPSLHSPIAGVMRGYIDGFAALGEAIAAAREAARPGRWLDLREIDFAGAVATGRYEYRVRLVGSYPQFLFWQAMPFFAPIPWEADRFYAQPGLEEKNVSLDWYPVGTGAFYLEQNNPNLRMVLARNPHFRGERYPSQGEPGDRHDGLLDDAGRELPFIDRAVYSLEKESIPRWNKFLQGYYDASGISSDSFDQTIDLGVGGEANLTDEMRARGIQLTTAVTASDYYMGINMLDPVVGGDGERSRLLRRAIAIAVDFEEFISIFLNGRGLAAQGPLPPGIFGHREGEDGINPYVYDWGSGGAVRKPLGEARRLMEQAGYAGGRDRDTGTPLVINFEAVSRGPDSTARFAWLRKQFAKLDIQLVIRATDYNRFREKMLKGTGQIFFWGWNADYPDPENFFFLLYGPNSKAQGGGENAANYTNERFDRLFERMKDMANGAERQRLIDEMVEIVRHDSPWLWGFHPKDFDIYHGWYHNLKPNIMANNTLKYVRIDPLAREVYRERWNQPVLWPLGVLALVLVSVVVPAVASYRRRERSMAV